MKGAQKVGKTKCGLREKCKEKMHLVPCPKLGSIKCCCLRGLLPPTLNEMAADP